MHPPAGLYIHIPFCLHKCPYCDFYSVTDRTLISDYIDALEGEMQLRRSCGLTFDSLYLGGGTPSCLESRELTRIVAAARRCFDLLPEAEVTLEVNPGTVSPDRLIACRRIGINRLNIGVQSLHEDNLRFLGRIHCVTGAVRTLSWARMAGFRNIGLDLIYGLPAQSPESWIVDLERAIDQRPEHLSCYQLTCEAGTPLAREVQAGRIQLPSDETVADLFARTSEFLEQHGYGHYEISNFARAGNSSNRSRHNQKYWAMTPYLGLGPSAHSFVEPLRWWNHSSVAAYIEAVRAGDLPTAGRESLTTRQLMMEAVYLGLRTSEGIDLAAFRGKFNVDFAAARAATIGELAEGGFLSVDGRRCVLTRKGLLCHERIAVMLTNDEWGLTIEN